MNKIRLGNRIVIMRMVIVIILFSISKHIHAQQNRVDSILAMMKECMPDNKLDSIKFDQIRLVLVDTKLNDSQIASIEKQSALLDRGVDQDRSYRIKHLIFSALIRADYDKAISYGQKTLQDVEASKTPHKIIIRDVILNVLRIPYRNSSRLEEGIRYFNTRLNDFREANDSSGIAGVHRVLAGFYSTTGLNDESIYHLKTANLYTNEDPDYDETFFGSMKRNNLANKILNLSYIGADYYKKGDMQQALSYSAMALDEERKLEAVNSNAYIFLNIIRVKLTTNELADIPELLQKAKDAETSSSLGRSAAIALVEAEYNIKTKSFDRADSILLEWKKLVSENNLVVNDVLGIIHPDYYLALLRIEQNRLDEAIELLDMDINRLGNLRLEILKDYQLQASLYEKLGDYKKAFLVNKKYLELQKEIQSDADKFRRVSFEVEQEMNQKELSIATLQSESRISSIIQKFTIGLALMFILLAAAIYYRFQSKKKANALLEATLANLKSTQAQLIQSEKMASLGELTAGIAHEIQNPLNFVNNFSEVSEELVAELKVELINGDLEEAKTISDDVIQNLQKIKHHGQRASDIVKGMLDHSRTSSGQKELTDLNALADEYLRLAYHRLRAKDKSFNADFKTDFDPTLPKINVIPQDIGRVLLNLINNAFYAAPLPSRSESGTGSAGGFKDPNYIHKPTVIVRTSSFIPPAGGPRGALISVKDNGPGIPDPIIDKIFQPFFTTKPTGQGTGLGLSLAYDIVKAHGGELKVETKEGEGTEFIIELPFSV